MTYRSFSFILFLLNLFSQGYAVEVHLSVEAKIDRAIKNKDFSSAYWFEWKKAKHHNKQNDFKESLKWYINTSDHLIKAQKADQQKPWKYFIHKSNSVQLQCELETVAAKLDRWGLASFSLSIAEKNMRDLIVKKGYQHESREKWPKGLVPIYLNLLLDRANHQERMGEIIQSINTFELILEILNHPKVFLKDHSQYRRRTYNNLGGIWWGLGNHQKTLDIFRQGLALIDSLDPAWSLKSNIIRIRSQLEGSNLELIEEMKKLIDDPKLINQHMRLGFKRRLATIMSHNDMMEEAQQLISEVIEKSRGRYPKLLREAQKWQGKMNHLDDQFEDAERQLKASIQASQAKGHRMDEFDSYRALVRLYIKMKRWQDALDLAQLILIKLQEMNIQYHIPACLTDISTCHLFLNHRDLADEFWGKAIEALKVLPKDFEFLRFRLWEKRIFNLNEAGLHQQAKQLHQSFKPTVKKMALSKFHIEPFLSWKLERIATTTSITENTLPEKISEVMLQPHSSSTGRHDSSNLTNHFSLRNDNWETVYGEIKILTHSLNFELDQENDIISAQVVNDLPLNHTFSIALQANETRVFQIIIPNSDKYFPIKIIWDDQENSQMSQWTYDPHLQKNQKQHKLIISQYDSLKGIDTFFFFRKFVETTDIKFVASKKCRIEIIDPQSHQHLGIDQEANGSFKDIGDNLYFDQNLNAYPDFQSQDDKPYKIKLRIFPHDFDKEPISIHAFFQTSNDKWEQLSICKLVFN